MFLLNVKLKFLDILTFLIYLQQTNIYYVNQRNEKTQKIWFRYNINFYDNKNLFESL